MDTQTRTFPLETSNMSEIGRLDKRQWVVEEEVPLDFIVETASSITLIGSAQCFTPTDAPLWRIKRVDQSVAGTTKIGWAEGNTKFAHVWEDRATLNFSNV